MKDLDVASICSRYSCVDFSNLPGFPNQLPKDAYILSNGPKFNGEDLTLTLEHIENLKHLWTFLELKRKMSSSDCSLIRFKANVENGLKVLLSDLLSPLHIFGISFLKHGWRKWKKSK